MVMSATPETLTPQTDARLPPPRRTVPRERLEFVWEALVSGLSSVLVVRQARERFHVTERQAWRYVSLVRRRMREIEFDVTPEDRAAEVNTWLRETYRIAREDRAPGAMAKAAEVYGKFAGMERPQRVIVEQARDAYAEEITGEMFAALRSDPTLTLRQFMERAAAGATRELTGDVVASSTEETR